MPSNSSGAVVVVVAALGNWRFGAGVAASAAGRAEVHQCSVCWTGGAAEANPPQKCEQLVSLRAAHFDCRCLGTARYFARAQWRVSLFFARKCGNSSGSLNSPPDVASAGTNTFRARGATSAENLPQTITGNRSGRAELTARPLLLQLNDSFAGGDHKTARNSPQSGGGSQYCLALTRRTHRAEHDGCKRARARELCAQSRSRVAGAASLRKPMNE